MSTFAKSYNPAENVWLVSALGGIFIALITAFVLRSSYVWAGLIIIGIAVFVFSLAAKDFRNYWLAVFALVLPLEIKKVLIDSEPVRALIMTYGIPVGELPAPVLHLSDLPFLVLMVHWLLEVTCRKQKIFFPKSNWMALALLGWSGISLLNAKDFSCGFFDLLRMVKFYFLYLYMANNVRSKETVKTLMNFFLIGVIFQGLLCLFQYCTQSTGYLLAKFVGKEDLYTELMKRVEGLYRVAEVGDMGRRASGTVGPTNAEAQYFEFFIPVTFLLWLTARNFRGRSLSFGALILGLLGLVVTFSRGGLIGIVVAIICVLILSRRFQLISNKKFLAILSLGLSMFIFVTSIGYKYFMYRPEAASARVHLAKVGLEMVKSHPFLGVGLNNHLILKPEYDPRSYAFPLATHNQFILIASEVGIPGLIFFLGFFGLTILLTLRAARSDDLYLTSVAVGILGALVSLGIHIQFDYFGTHTNYTLLWLYAGLAAAMSRLNIDNCEKIG